MKKILLTLGFVIPVLLFSQEFYKKNMSQPDGSNIQLNNLLKMQQAKGDTIWLFHRYDINKWENGEFHQDEYANIDYYPSSTNIKSIVWIGNKNDTLIKYFYNYDYKDRVISTITQNYYEGVLIDYQKVDQYYYTLTGYDSLYIFYKKGVNDTVWNKDMLRGIVYNEIGFTYLDTTAVWDGQQWKISQGGKNEFVLNEFGNITGSTTSIYNPYINNWVKSFKYKYFLINDTTGEFNAYDIFFWKNNQWENGERYTDVILHNWEGWNPNERFKVEFLIQQLGDGNSWYLYKKDSLVYFDNGGSIYYKFVWDDGIWKNKNRYRDIWNDMKMRILKTLEEWKNNEWDTTWADRYSYEYFGSIYNVLHYEAYDTALMKWVPAYDHVLSDFTYILNTPEAGILDLATGLKIIPNPSKSSILIRLKDESDGIKSVLVYDISGRQVFGKKYGTGQAGERVDISSLENGTYIINVKTREGRNVKGKFIKN